MSQFAEKKLPLILFMLTRFRWILFEDKTFLAEFITIYLALKRRTKCQLFRSLNPVVLGVDCFDREMGEIMLMQRTLGRGGGGYFIINSYGRVRRKDFCYDPIPEIWSDIDTQSQNICQILIPNRRSNKNKSTSKG